MEDFNVYDDPDNKNEDLSTSGGTEQVQKEIKTESSQQEGIREETVHIDNTVREKPLKDHVEQHEEPKVDKKQKEKKQRSCPFLKKHKTATIIAACIILSAGAGFGGSLVALNITNGNKAVLYQGVDNSGSNTNTTTSANGTTMSVEQVANKTMESVVEIKTESVSTNSFYQQAIQSGAGSGVILSKDGYIVTNNHVIAGANKVTVTTKDSKSYSAKLIGTDPTSDLAVIKIDAKNLTPAVLGQSSKLKVGDTAVAIGNPLGELGGTVTSGIISALDREITIDNETMHLLQTSAAINPGNSGGGLFNDQGQLIGIVNAKSSGNNIEGLGFAIPIDRAKDIISSLIKNGQVKGRASLGVTLQEGNPNNPFVQDNKSQVFIVQVVEGKAASKAGLKPGDQILKADGKNVNSITDVKNAVNSHKAGDKMTITVLRDNETKNVTITLGEADTSSTKTSNNDFQQNPRNPQ